MQIQIPAFWTVFWGGWIFSPGIIEAVCIEECGGRTLRLSWWEGEVPSRTKPKAALSARSQPCKLLPAVRARGKELAAELVGRRSAFTLFSGRTKPKAALSARSQPCKLLPAVRARGKELAAEL